MGSRKGTTNNPAHEKNLVRFNSETARAAALKSAEVRREKAAAKAAVAAAESRSLEDWVAEYKREELGTSASAAAQKICHDILSGAISDPKALVSALPVLVDIARLEQGLHTSATMHASVSLPGDAMDRITALRQQALVSGGSDSANPLDVRSSEQQLGAGRNESS